MDEKQIKKYYDEQIRKGTFAYLRKEKVIKIKESPEYKKAVQLALSDGIKRRPSERGKIKNQILQKFLHGA
jgi:hypothetical protein